MRLSQTTFRQMITLQGLHRGSPRWIHHQRTTITRQMITLRGLYRGSHHWTISRRMIFLSGFHRGSHQHIQCRQARFSADDVPLAPSISTERFSSDSRDDLSLPTLYSYSSGIGPRSCRGNDESKVLRHFSHQCISHGGFFIRSDSRSRSGYAYLAYAQARDWYAA